MLTTARPRHGLSLLRPELELLTRRGLLESSPTPLRPPSAWSIHALSVRARWRALARVVARVRPRRLPVAAGRCARFAAFGLLQAPPPGCFGAPLVVTRRRLPTRWLLRGGRGRRAVIRV